MKKIKKLLMGRTMIVAMAILIQLLWILSLLNGVMAKYSYVDTIVQLIAVIVVLVIVNKRSNPSYKIASSLTFLEL